MQANHLGLLGATWVTWVMAWTMTFVLIGSRKPFALLYGKVFNMFFTHAHMPVIQSADSLHMNCELSRC